VQLSAPGGRHHGHSASEATCRRPEVFGWRGHLERDFVETCVESLAREEQPKPGKVTRSLGKESNGLGVRARSAAIDAERSTAFELLNEVLSWMPLYLHALSLFRGVGGGAISGVRGVGIPSRGEYGCRGACDEGDGREEEHCDHVTPHVIGPANAHEEEHRADADERRECHPGDRRPVKTARSRDGRWWFGCWLDPKWQNASRGALVAFGHALCPSIQARRRRAPTPVPPLDTSPRGLSERPVPAMSRCAQGMLRLTCCLRNTAACDAPP